MDEILRERVKTFTSLRAAQRALARCLHPTRLVAVRESGRQILIELQALGDSAKAEPNAESLSAECEDRLERIDGLLAHQVGSTLEIVSELDFAQLRATGPKLCVQYPEEVRALIDVMLLGDLADSGHLGILEFLITMVCTEGWNGRRTVVHEPADLTPGLRAFAARAATQETSSEVVDKLQAVTASLGSRSDHYLLRTEMRALKQGLGAELLRADVLSSVVGYNVAMWNYVAAAVDASMAIDEFADELLADFETSAGKKKEVEAAAGSLTRGAAKPPDLLGGPEFSRVIDALRARIIGEAYEDLAARRIAAAFDLSSVRPIEAESLKERASDPSSDLIRKAVVLSQIIRNRREIQDSLDSLPLDAQILESHCLDDLAGKMTAVGRKLFADSQYSKAFELSEVKTRNLAALCEDALRRAQRDSLQGNGKHAGDQRPVSKPKRRFGFNFGLPPIQLALVVGVIICVGIPAFWLPDARRDDELSETTLSSLSPFIASGEHREIQGEMHFIGRLGETWDYLGTTERREVAETIARRLSASGIQNYSLSNAKRQLLVLWREGQLVEVVAKRKAG